MARVSIAEGKGFWIDGTVLPVLSGTLHYWRHDPSDWSALLRAVKNLGFLFVETYVPWGVHELAPKSFDFGGVDPSRNLEAFIGTVKKAGLKLIVRPGPHINAELEDFGYPRRIVTDPGITAREAHGGPALMDTMARPFGIPSYASEMFHRETAGWFDALAPILRRNLYPQGPVVAVQVDNETGYFFRTGAYTLDYHPDSIAWYRCFLRERYGDVEALNEAYGTTHPSFDPVEPPRRFTGKGAKDLPYHLDWQDYKEWQILQSLRRLRNLWTERGVTGIPFFQNFFGSFETPYDVTAVEAGEDGLDVAGLDDYSRRESHPVLLHKALFLSGTSRLPFVPEFGAGAWAFPPCGFAPDEDDTRFTLPLLFMGGVKAVNHYMIVERDRWMGSPLSAKGTPRKGVASIYKEFNAFIREARIHELEIQADVLLMADRGAGKLERALSLADDHPFLRIPRGAATSGVELPFSPAPHEDHPRRLRKILDFALEQRLPFRASDTALPLEAMRRTKAVLLPTYGLMERSAQERLSRFVRGGGVAILGPALPAVDERMRPCACFPAYEVGRPMSIGKGRILLLEEWDGKAALDFLLQAGVSPLLPNLPRGFLATRFTGEAGGAKREVLFLANPTDRDVEIPKDREKGDPDWKPLYGTSKPWKAGRGLTLPSWSVLCFEVPQEETAISPPSHPPEGRDLAAKFVAGEDTKNDLDGMGS